MEISEESEVIYKGLTFRINQKLNYLEFVIDHLNFSGQEKYIPSVSHMLEYALTIHPEYIILNRTYSEFSVNQKLFSFTSNNIILPLKTDGVRKIICTGTETEYQTRYKEIEQIEPFIKWAPSKQSAIEWIRNNRE